VLTKTLYTVNLVQSGKNEIKIEPSRKEIRNI